MKTKTAVIKFNKQHIKQLLTDFSQAQDHCRALEKDSREARAEVDNIKAQLIELHRNGIELRSGSLEAVVTESSRDGYFVKPSTRISVIVKEHQ